MANVNDVLEFCTVFVIYNEIKEFVLCTLKIVLRYLKCWWKYIIFNVISLLKFFKLYYFLPQNAFIKVLERWKIVKAAVDFKHIHVPFKLVTIL